MRTSLAAVLCVVGGLCLSPGCSSEHDPEDMADVLDFSVPADAQALADLTKLPCEADPATATCLVGAGHTTIQSAIDDAACTRVCVPSGTYSERLLVRRAVEVIGYGAGSSIIDGSAAGRVIDVATAEAVVFRGLTVRNGNGDEGAGIRSTAILSLDAVTVSGNAATLRGAGIFQRGGSLTLAQNSVVQDNVLTVQRTGTESPYVSYGGAGLYATQTMVLVDESAISKNACSLTWTNNDANVSGGGVLVENASLVLTHSTISENTVAGRSPTLNSYVQGGGVACLNSTLLAFEGTTLTKNTVTASGDAASTRATGQGGALALTQSSASLVGVTISENKVEVSLPATQIDAQANAFGGGIYSFGGTVTGNALTINNNVATATASKGISFGGALYVQGTIAYLSHSSVDANSARGESIVANGYSGANGGAIFYWGAQSAATALTLTGTTVSRNIAQAKSVGAADSAGANGGGLYEFGNSMGTTVTLVNTTVSGNQARSQGAGTGANAGGGGVCVQETNTAGGTKLAMFNATIAGNVVDAATGKGGGIVLVLGGGSLAPSVTMSNTILAANIAMTGADCSTPGASTLSTYGYNLIGNSSGCALSGGGIGDLLNIDAKLEVLSSNGGSTMTHALTTMSPAVNAGRPGGCLDQASAPLSVDQRGQPRPSGSTGSDRCDIGAFEL